MIILLLLFVLALVSIVDMVAYFQTPPKVRVNNLYSLLPLVGGLYIYWRWQKDIRGRV